MLEHNINIVTGHYGSGKTEFSVNFALELKKTHEKVILVDLDIVNPYFRSNDSRKLLEDAGIDVIAPHYAGTNVDIPVLPPEIMRVFEEKDAKIVIDVGGDDDGAIALGRYKKYFDANGYEMYLVINTRRPLTTSEDEIIRMKEDIESASRLSVTGLISDTNIAGETTPEIVMEGFDVVNNVSKKTGLLIKFICAEEKVASNLPDTIKDKIFTIVRRTIKI
ncbi:MAG: hypothetical protein IKU87_02585 [Clostridia bacterium]|nr:hypothetical protein [Clostridia bacterium]